MKKLLIISNDKLHFNSNFIFSDYNDTINIIEGLSKKNYLNFISRKNITKGIYQAKVTLKSKLSLSEIKSIELKNQKICMISITPFNYLIFLIIIFFHNKVNGFVILRSDGFREYETKYGVIGKKFYGILFKKILKYLKPIVVTDKLSNLTNFNYYKIHPSEITEIWKKKLKKTKIDKARLIYIGRIKKEKGIFSLLKLVRDFSIDFKLSIVGQNKNKFLGTKNIKFYDETSSVKKIINYYDMNNIFILPSYTEGSPKVIYESLSRLRPVIVFKEISHVKKKLKGVFICSRDAKDLQRTIEYILKNYKKIQSEIKKNKILSRKKFQRDLIKIIK